MANKLKYFILTGDPGVGKTTLTKKLTSLMNEIGIKTAGFYTEEVRKNRVREGFDVVTLEGVRGRLARDQSLLNGPVKLVVGKYGVLIQEFESIALPSISPIADAQLCLVIDEIGKMELFSDPFRTRIKEIFNNNSVIVLATIPVRSNDPCVRDIRKKAAAKVWVVTRENRNIIHEDIFKEIKAVFNIV